MSTQKGSDPDRPAKITTQTVVDMKYRGERISMLTAYDYTMARIIDAADIDVILIGDSASNVMAGYETTVPMTLEHMIYHASCVVRGVNRALVIADLPFMSYQVTSKEALISAGRMMKEAGVHGVKLEGGKPIVNTVKKIVDAGIPVMGHLGLTPQSIYKFGTYKVRATDQDEAAALMEDARRLEEAGCFSLVLEKIPAELAKKVSEEISIPTIGIGAGASCDGQVLVTHDMLGLNKEFNPRFLRRYADLHTTITEAVQSFIKDIKAGNFPNKDEQYG